MADQPRPWSAPPPPPLRRRLAGGGVLLLLALLTAGITVAGILPGSGPPLAVQGNPDETVLRQHSGTGPAMRYGDTPIYDACSLVTIESLARLGASLSRDHSVGHKHLDADTPAAITPDTSEPISSCRYVLADNDSLHVKVHQTPYNSADSLTLMKDRATRANAPVSSSAGLSSAMRYEPQAEHLAIWRDGLLVEISLETKHHDDLPATFTTQLETLVRPSLSSAPTAPMRHSFAAPFDRVKDPCEIVSTEAYRAAFPTAPGAPSIVDASYPLHAPIASRGYRTARGASFSCTRNSIVPRGTHSLRADIQVWTEQGPPDSANDLLCEPSRQLNGLVPVTPPIGTRRSCLFELVRDWQLAFQVDRVNVTLSGEEVESKPESSARRDQLVPAGRQITAAGLFR